MIVRKYGGTSVGSLDKIESLAKRTLADLSSSKGPFVIVLSAMAGETNRLIDSVRSLNPRASSRTVDLAAACGEQFSVALFTAALEKHGAKVCPLLAFQLGIMTDGAHSRARIRNIKIDRIMDALERGEIPVVAGYQGLSVDNNLTTLGRGGSDTSAVAIAAALKAKRCEIYTDVRGLLSADPKIVPTARLIDRIDYDTALELAALGSKVLHSRCVELASKYKIELLVAEAHSPNNIQEGTWIMSKPEEVEFLESAVVSGIAVDRNVVRCHLRGKDFNFDDVDIFAKLAEAGVNIDVIVYDDHNHSIAFTTTKEQLEECRSIVSALKGIECVTDDGLAKVSIVGLGMQHQHGVAAQVFGLCNRQSIDIKMISTSEIKISVVVSDDVAPALAQSLHKHFLEKEA